MKSEKNEYRFGNQSVSQIGIKTEIFETEEENKDHVDKYVEAAQRDHSY